MTAAISRLTMRQTEPQKILRAELSKRVRKNPKYSLRSFARASGVSHTVLSLVMNGKRPLSRKAAVKLAGFLSLPPEEQSLFTRRPDEANAPKDAAYRQISLDTFSVISEWYHLAILSLLELPRARFEARWIAHSLSIPESEVRLAMERLLRLELVEEISPGRFRQAGKPLKVENTVSTGATRLFHRQLLEKALEALETVPVEERDHSSMTLAIDPAHVPYARKRIQQFRRELAADLEAKGNPEVVYELAVQLFPVSTKLKPAPAASAPAHLPKVH